MTRNADCVNQSLRQIKSGYVRFWFLEHLCATPGARCEHKMGQAGGSEDASWQPADDNACWCRKLPA